MIRRPTLQDVHWVYFWRWTHGRLLGDVARVVGSDATAVGRILKRMEGRTVNDAHLDAIAAAEGISALQQVTELVGVAIELERYPEVLGMELKRAKAGRARGRRRG